jgi:FSR family fosmidomycin resistance protein-like MFS transporter
MTQTAELIAPASRTTETRFVGGVCFAHFVSHFYIMLLAPMFLFVRQDYGVSYTELGLAYTAFNVVSTALQTPAGFLVDRVSARAVLIAGLLIGSAAFTFAALFDSFWVFVAMFGLAGLGNTAYHPADYALLSRHVPKERVGRVFSFHTFTGMLGNAAAPPSLLFMQTLVGWRGAFLGAAVLGLVAALVLVLLREPPLEPGHAGRQAAATAAGPAGPARPSWRILLSAPILLNLLFFILLSVSGGGLNNYLVVALGALHGTTPELANTALTGLLLLSALGVLVGGMLTSRTSRHGLVAAGGLIVTALIAVTVGMVDPGALALVLLMSVGGFFSGLTMPSRDMIVRMVTPPGAFGMVFGFVTTGFNIGGMVSPLIFGLLLDHGHAREIFFVIAASSLLAIATVVIGNANRRPGASA